MLFKNTRNDAIIHLPLHHDRLDPKKAIRRLKVEKLATRAGTANLPDPGDTELDTQQKGFVNYFQWLLAELNAVVDAKLNDDNIRRADYLRNIDAVPITECVNLTKHRLAELQATSREPLIAARRAERKAHRELNQFRVDNGLDRDAVYPDSAFLLCAVLIALCVSESAANASFFGISSDLGLLGGFLQALIIAVFNVTLSAFAGVALRGCNHVSPVRRASSVILMLAYAAVIVVFHAAMANYRSALQLDPEQAVYSSMRNLVEHPFLYLDLSSWLLFSVGILFALIALMKGYRADDVYPGYGAVARRHKEVEANYRVLADKYDGNITAAGRAQVAAVDACIKEALTGIGEFTTSLASSRQLIKLYETAKATIINCCNVVLSRYQALNMRVRNVKPPTYFGKAFVFPTSDFLEIPELDKEREIVEGFPATIRALQGKSEEAKHQIRETETMTLEQKGEYFAQIERTVDEGLAADTPSVRRPQLVYQPRRPSEVHHVQ